MPSTDPLPQNFYDDPGFDRRAERRTDEAFIAESLAAETSRLIPVWRGRHAVAGPPEQPRALMVTAGRHPINGLEYVPAYLGHVEEAAYFAISISGELDPAGHPAFAEASSFADLRAIGPLMERREGSLLAYARALSWFHDRHRFCGVCGSPTLVREAGHARLCANPACASLVYPRTDPAVIVLVHHEDRCLLARSPRFITDMYSVLAGFVEAGESLEACVRREIMEEAGIAVGAIRYQSSQPWPFPQSLMLGFRAEALTTEIRIDENELEDARWVSRDAVAEMERNPARPGEGAMLLPRADSIARRLIRDWLRDG